MSSLKLPRMEGVVSRQAHADLPPGTYEREQGREGFGGAVTHFHHKHPHTAWSDWEGEIRPQLFDWSRYEADTTSPWDAAVIAHNPHIHFRMWSTRQPMDHLVRNGDGDEMMFLHQGDCSLYCDYGHIDLKEGDYFLLPRGTMWRIEPNGPLKMLLIEATNESFTIPDRGLLGPNALFDRAVLDTPRLDDQFRAQQRDNEKWKVVFKKRGRHSTILYPFNPLDAVGWHGDLAPVRLNWRDIRPLTSHRYHVPPSAHTTFITPRFVIATFVPRPIETDPGALKVPFFHNNDDYDEIGFLHRGRFFSRDNFGPGMMTFHPSGFTHGPHPKAFEAAETHTMKETQEVLVNIDTRDPLELDAVPDGVEVKDYVNSWRGWLKRLGYED